MTNDNIKQIYNIGMSIKDDPEEYNTTFILFNLVAKKGYAPAQVQLGRCYRDGKGTQVSYTDALYWFYKSLDQDNTLSFFYIGYMYEQGLGVEKDEEEAFNYYMIAAERGNSWAQFNVGTFYQFAKGNLKVDLNKARKWYEKAADQGEEVAQLNAGILNMNKFIEVSLDIKEKLTSNAERLSNEEEDGPFFVKGMDYLEKASAQGNESAQEILDSYKITFE